MKCYKCNSEVNANSNFCEKCGAPIKVNKMSKRKKVTIGIVMSILIIVVAAFVGVKTYIDRKPSEKQIKKDLKEIIVSNYHEKVDISKINIESENKIDNTYSIKLWVTFSSDDVERKQKYSVSYEKKDEWKLENFDFSEEEKWEEKPLKAPDKEKVLQEIKDMMEENDGNSNYVFNKITESDNQEKPNLDEGIAYYYYDVEEDSELRNFKGKIKVEYVFDYLDDAWAYSTYEITDEDVTLKVDGTWTGKGIVSGSYEDYDSGKNFKLKITEVDGEKICAEITKSKKTYSLSGTIDIKNLSVNMYGADNSSIYLEGSFDYNTTDFSGKFYTEYDPDRTIYYRYSVFDIELKKKK